jgi:hypothetical protein
MLAKLITPSEHQIQSAFFAWVRLSEKKYPVLRLMFAVPNAGKRGYKTASMMVAEGLRKGVLDVMFPVARIGFNGLAIEFKKPGGKMTTEQAEYTEMLVNENWLAVVMTDTESAISTVKNYLNIKQ